MTALEVARAAFRAASRGGGLRAAASRRRAKVGTQVSYSRSVPARVRFRVERRKAGRRVRGKCRKRTRRNRKRRKCNLRLKGSFTHQGRRGGKCFVFTGGLMRRKLKPGRYNLVASSGRSTRRDRFRIVRR